MNPLQARAKEFLQRPTPTELPYVEDSISERLLKLYAQQGEIEPDSEWAELAGLCVMEAHSAADSATGEVAAYFRESAEILEAIETELGE